MSKYPKYSRLPGSLIEINATDTAAMLEYNSKLKNFVDKIVFTY
jgi:hypothetical protein